MSETNTNLKYGFATILVLVGLKMSLIDLVQIPVGISLSDFFSFGDFYDCLRSGEEKRDITSTINS
jgi:predicted tellurium resistance membrane protein TerC